MRYIIYVEPTMRPGVYPRPKLKKVGGEWRIYFCDIDNRVYYCAYWSWDRAMKVAFG